MKKIAVFGSTGSIGTQTLDEVRRHPEEFRVCALSAHTNRWLFFEQIRTFRPQCACLSGTSLGEVPDDLRFCQFYRPEELTRMAAESGAEDVMVAIVGVAGLEVTMAARRAGKRILLANKETLVAGGELVMKECPAENGVPTLLPVDSEHSAIFQCLEGRPGQKAARIFLTASGGPFRTWEKERIERATPAEALKHPNWNMGAKITIDSASMFNKGLEIMEARWLFDLPEDRIEVVVHPESIVHSAVVFKDGAVLAQLGLPDMRVPIGYAMAYPERLETGVEAPDLFAMGKLTFEKPDEQKFPALRLARESLRAGGAACTVFNGANEEAVAAFLREEIPFGEIARRVEKALEKLGGLPAKDLDDILEADRRARLVVKENH